MILYINKKTMNTNLILITKVDFLWQLDLLQEKKYEFGKILKTKYDHILENDIFYKIFKIKINERLMIMIEEKE